MQLAKLAKVSEYLFICWGVLYVKEAGFDSIIACWKYIYFELNGEVKWIAIDIPPADSPKIVTYKIFRKFRKNSCYKFYNENFKV